MSSRSTTSRQPAEVLRQLERHLDRENQRLDSRREELSEVREAIRDFVLTEVATTSLSRHRDIEVVPSEVAADIIGGLYDEIGPESCVRNSTQTFDTGPGIEDERVRDLQNRLAGGMEMRVIYPLSLLDSASGRRWVGAWAEAGEQQRFVPEPPSEFLIAGESAVMACSEWNQPEADYVVIRDPMIVQAFIALHDAVYAAGVPLQSSAAGSDDDRLIDLMALGLKDEAIARAIGTSLRTVRRRIAGLMDEEGVETRFQLGAALQVRGRLGAGGLPERPLGGRRRTSTRPRR
ncbi:MAG: hypothetical protein Q4G67_14355 [Actinomycetia bacterium]|nr:hypothetical protein [Actinomycetes bacterium]